MRIITLLAFATIASSCDQQPKTPLEIGMANKKRNESEDSERFKTLEGKTGYVYVYKEQIGTDVTYHLRRDCPKLEESLKSILDGKAVKVTFKGGKIFDDDGFFYKGFNCGRCCP